jgi:cyclophilin family peptidyl-prolyl cis-trans isomerase
MRLLKIGTLLLVLAVAGTALAQDKPAAAPAAANDVAFTQIDAFISGAKIDKTKPDWKTTLPVPRAAKFDPKATYLMRMTTNKGPIVIKFMPDVAPMHVTNFIYLAKLGFFDGLSFHRVITGFMAQGGDPLGTGTGGPGYQFDGETKPEVKHGRPGLLSMANAGPGTDGSQFFLTFVPTPWLDGKHTIFGEVIEGMDTLKKLEAAGTKSGATTSPLKLEKATVEVKR